METGWPGSDGINRADPPDLWARGDTGSPGSPDEGSNRSEQALGGISTESLTDGVNLEQLRGAQQEDAKLVAVVAWVHGRRPSREEVETCSSDLQQYYQLLPYLYVDEVGLLRVSQIHPGGMPKGRLVIPVHPEIRENILQQGHIHTLEGISRTGLPFGASRTGTSGPDWKSK